jgi:hypothetical protein
MNVNPDKKCIMRFCLNLFFIVRIRIHKHVMINNDTINVDSATNGLKYLKDNEELFLFNDVLLIFPTRDISTSLFICFEGMLFEPS